MVQKWLLVQIPLHTLPAFPPYFAFMASIREALASLASTFPPLPPCFRPAERAVSS